MSVTNDKNTLRVLKGIGFSVLLPLAPVAARFIISSFSLNQVAKVDPNDLLYYSFAICILILARLRGNTSVLVLIAQWILCFICFVTIVLITLVTTGTATYLVRPFSIIVAIICGAFCCISEIAEGKLRKEDRA